MIMVMMMMMMMMIYTSDANNSNLSLVSKALKYMAFIHSSQFYDHEKKLHVKYYY